MIEMYTIDYTTTFIILLNVMDALLSTIITLIVDYVIIPNDQNKREYNIQKMLVFNRLCLSTIFIYFLTDHMEFLKKSHISAMFSTQLSISFTSSLIGLFDWYGKLKRHILGPLFSYVQSDLNCFYSGTTWSLAEKYTHITKIMLVSLIYSFIVPISLFIGSLAFITLYFIDRYLILRKYRQSVMYNADIGDRFHEQAIGCLAFHMVVTCRVIYSWPMDNIIYHHNIQKYELIKKTAPYDITSYYTQDWMSNTQKFWLEKYKIITIIIIIIAMYLLIIYPYSCVLYSIFFESTTTTTTTNTTPATAKSEILVEDEVDEQRPTYSIVEKTLQRYVPEIVHNLTNDKCTLCVRDDDDDNISIKKYLDNEDLSYLFSNDDDDSCNSNCIRTKQLLIECLSLVQDFDLESAQCNNEHFIGNVRYII